MYINIDNFAIIAIEILFLRSQSHVGYVYINSYRYILECIYHKRRSYKEYFLTFGDAMLTNISGDFFLTFYHLPFFDNLCC